MGNHSLCWQVDTFFSLTRSAKRQITCTSESGSSLGIGDTAGEFFLPSSLELRTIVKGELLRPLIVTASAIFGEEEVIAG